MSLISRFKNAVSKTVEKVKEAFGGGGDDDGGSQYAPTKSYRPIVKPRIGSVKTPEGKVERFATVDIPNRNISAGDRTTDPESSVYSFSGLFGQDDANVMRRIQNADRMNALFPPVVRDNKDKDRDRPAPEPEKVTPTIVTADKVPPEPELEPEPVGESGMTVAQEERIEAAGEAAAAEQKKLGLAQTIATSPQGLLAGGEGTTRRRRSLMGGGLIV
jgi:hypothetical protein